MNQIAKPRGLDLADIQGNIVRPYGRFGFPIARHFFFNIAAPAAGRAFIEQLRHEVTTAERWAGIDDPNPQAPQRPLVAINVGFSFRGLLALALPTRTLANMPEEFIDGMAERWSILGDFGNSGQPRWDAIWRAAGADPAREIHVWVSLNAQAEADGTAVDELAGRTAWLRGLASGGISLLGGHAGANPDWQDSAALMETSPEGGKTPTAKEHFGFTDGIGDPTFTGQYDPDTQAEEVIGGGKLSPGWQALATGEFILGHAGEAQELPPTAPPWSFMRNGTFMVYRKLHQNIGSFKSYIAGQAALFGAVTNAAGAEQTLMAKMVGRWPNGIPIAIAPSFPQAEALASQWADIPALQAKKRLTPVEKARLQAYELMLTDFRYGDDADGAKCPLTAHIRRTNPRDALNPLLGTAKAATDSALSNRRRIMRRGAPYGETTPDDSGEHGVIFMALCTSIFRQFEFIQQQWVHYGASFNAGNDTDPLVGLRRDGAKFVIPASDDAGVPFICADIPSFVETRGGEYFFLPSLTGLREIAQGSVDPT